MTSRIHPRILLVEGKKDKRVVPELIEANGVLWLDPSTNEPIVYIKEFDGITNLLQPGAIEAELKATGLSHLGIVIDANGDAQENYTRVHNHCVKAFPSLASDIQPTGIVDTNLEGLRIGIWLMPDNFSRGMMETFLMYLVPNDADTLLQYATEVSEKARAIGAPFKGGHINKATIHTWLAWQDEPGRQLHEAVRHKILNPNSPHAVPFVAWFRQLYEV